MSTGRKENLVVTRIRECTKGGRNFTQIIVHYRLEDPVMMELGRELTVGERTAAAHRTQTISGDVIGLLYYAIKAYNQEQIPSHIREDLIGLATRTLGINCSP